MQFSIKTNLRSQQDRARTKAVTDSNQFPGHDNRMRAHIHRIRNHECERTNGERCADCIRRSKR